MSRHGSVSDVTTVQGQGECTLPETTEKHCDLKTVQCLQTKGRLSDEDRFSLEHHLSLGVPGSTLSVAGFTWAALQRTLTSPRCNKWPPALSGRGNCLMLQLKKTRSVLKDLAISFNVLNR
ncbi:hypothetical protein Bbelb_298250 [Branchiostoma belcheri]|nr:hypothetical protein Bbelb_298250 [Branchiostoma belcheri]